MLLHHGQFAGTRALFEEGRELRQLMGDRLGVAYMDIDLCWIADWEGDYATAHAFAAERLAIERELDNAAGIQSALSQLGNLELNYGDAVQAKPRVEERLAIARQLGRKGAIADSLQCLGLIALALGQHAEAYAHLEDAVRIVGEINDRGCVIVASSDLAWVTLATGEVDRARELFTECLIYYHDRLSQWSLSFLGQPAIANCIHGIAAASALQGNLMRAARLWGAAESILKALGGRLSGFFVQGHDYQQRVAAIHTQLDEATFAAAWAEGQQMTLEQAIAEALSSASPQG
jgi:tetratricopeptide (TPR) repeat protein